MINFFQIKENKNMSLIKWTPLSIDPFEDMENFMENFSFPSIKSFVPAIDIYQDKDSVVVEAPLAGIDPNKVDISIENDILTIKGSMEKKNEVEEKNYYRKEIRSGSFYRSIALPAHVVGDKAEAVFDKGMLKITIPKEEKNKPKSIKVKVK